MKSFPYHGANENLKPHLERIITGGEYELYGLNFPYPPTVLDLGANVGAYAYWALNRWPGAFIYSYEPDPENVKAYLKNLHETFPLGSWRIFQGVVTGSSAPTQNLYLSQVNTGMHSIHKNMTNTICAQVIQVPNYHPNRLPGCDILKLDTEGCELEILKAYLASHQAPTAICMEYHSRYDYYEIDRMLDKTYTPCTGMLSSPDVGTINYVNNTWLAPPVDDITKLPKV